MLDHHEIASLGEGAVLVRDGLLGGTADRVRVEIANVPLRPAGTGKSRHLDASVRGDEIGWLDADAGPATAALFDVFESLRLELNREAFLGLRRFEVQLARYPGDGAIYARHRDAFAGDNQRVVTAIYYLNPGWTPAAGGALRVHGPDGARDVEPRHDRLVVFLSELVEHEVLPVFEPRLAITAWYRRDLP